MSVQLIAQNHSQICQDYHCLAQPISFAEKEFSTPARQITRTRVLDFASTFESHYSSPVSDTRNPAQYALSSSLPREQVFHRCGLATPLGILSPEQFTPCFRIHNRARKPKPFPANLHQATLFLKFANTFYRPSHKKYSYRLNVEISD